MKISAVLLAGGESRRFGQDKATFLWENTPLWKRQLTTLQETDADEILLSARADPAWRPENVIFVPDASPFCGPLGGLLASLRCMSRSHLLALAIDMPLMISSYLRRLMEETKPGCGVLPILNGKSEPLAAIYPTEAASFLQEARDKGQDFSLQSVAGRLVGAGHMRTVSIQPGEKPLFINVNRLSNVRA